MPCLSACALTQPAAAALPGLSEEIDQVFLGYQRPSSILRALYCLFKSKQKKTSLSFICRQAGIPSKGYLALVMNGERRLHAKYWDGISHAFKLNPQQRALLHALLELEQLDSADARLELGRRIEQLRVSLSERALFHS